MIAIFTVMRAAFGYVFLVFITRIVGRRPGKQLAPFEFVLVFYLGGLTLTGVVGNEMSLTNAVCQIFTIALCHYGLAWIRLRSAFAMKVLDGCPLFLLLNGQWRTHTLGRMQLQDDDVMDVAREQGIRDLTGIRAAVLEVFGQINIIRAKEEHQASKDLSDQGEKS